MLPLLIWVAPSSFRVVATSECAAVTSLMVTSFVVLFVIVLLLLYANIFEDLFTVLWTEPWCTKCFQSAPIWNSIFWDSTGYSSRAALTPAILGGSPEKANGKKWAQEQVRGRSKTEAEGINVGNVNSHDGRYVADSCRSFLPNGASRRKAPSTTIAASTKSRNSCERKTRRR